MNKPKIREKSYPVWLSNIFSESNSSSQGQNAKGLILSRYRMPESLGKKSWDR